jgi:hypothetical protein
VFSCSWWEFFPYLPFFVVGGLLLISVTYFLPASSFFFLPESAQHFLFYADTFKFFMKEFTERAEEYLQDVSGSAIHTQQVIQAVSVQLVNTLSSVSRIADETSTLTYDALMRLLTMENMLNHLLQQSDAIKSVNDDLLAAYHASREENGQLRTEIH